MLEMEPLADLEVDAHPLEINLTVGLIHTILREKAMTRFFLKSVSLFWLITFYSFFSQTHAHLIDDNLGTLNITDDGAYLVISLPIEFFKTINEDWFSIQAINNHRNEIFEIVKRNITLSNSKRKFGLSGLMLSIETAHKKEMSLPKNLVILGRFESNRDGRFLKFENNLFCETCETDVIKMRVTDKKKGFIDTFDLTPESHYFEIPVKAL